MINYLYMLEIHALQLLKQVVNMPNTELLTVKSGTEAWRVLARDA